MADRGGILLVKSGAPATLPEWRREFDRLAPGLEVHWWDTPGLDASRVRYVIAWQPPPGWLAGLPRLEVIFSSSAGVDHIVSDPLLPRHLPIVRMATAELAQTVGEYVAMAALMLLRDEPRLARAAAGKAWDYFEPPRTAPGTRVGILGLGAMGRRALDMLRGLGFDVAGWSRTPRSIAGVRTCHGPEGLAELLAGTRILVGLLPGTVETWGLLDDRRLALLPRGASIINAGRGSLIVARDLMGALDAGHIDRAILDVFETEPLPPDDPLWSHPRVLVTSHVAGYSTLPVKAAHVAAIIGRHERGEPLTHLYDPARGY